MLYVFIIGILLILFCGWIADMAVESEWIFIIGAMIGFVMVCISAVYGLWYLCTSLPPEKPSYSITVTNDQHATVFEVDECKRVSSDSSKITYYVDDDMYTLIVPEGCMVVIEPIPKPKERN